MKKLATVFSILILVLSCRNGSPPTSATASDTNVAETALPDAEVFHQDTVPQNVQVDSVIHLSFAPGTSAVQAKGHLEKKGDPVICMLHIVQGKKLTASLVPENKNATIRFSQIFLPNGKSDGPFGQTLSYDLPMQGLYKIHIAPNKMAGDPASTDFILNVRVE